MDISHGIMLTGGIRMAEESCAVQLLKGVIYFQPPPHYQIPPCLSILTVVPSSVQLFGMLEEKMSYALMSHPCNPTV